jgi:hypothetical protein
MKGGRVCAPYICMKCRRGYNVWLWLVFHQIVAGHWDQSVKR